VSRDARSRAERVRDPERELNMVVRDVGRWRKFLVKVIDETLADPERQRIAFMLGTPQKVQLGGDIVIRRDRRFDRKLHEAAMLELARRRDAALDARAGRRCVPPLARDRG